MNDDADEVKSLASVMRDGVVTELGFSVDVKRAEEVLRGTYDVSVLQRDHPQLVALVTWMLSLPGMKIDAIAKGSGMAWETVAAIQKLNQKPIREFKLRACEKLSLVIDAAMGGLMEQAAQGKLKAFDLKLLVDAFQQLSGEGHVMRFEGSKPEDPKRQAFRQFLETGLGMVLEAESVLPLAALSGSGERVELLQGADLVGTGDSEFPVIHA